MAKRDEPASGTRHVAPAAEAAGQEGLLETASHAARINALLGLGLTAEELATTYSVAVSTVRNWQEDVAVPRHRARLLTDDLRLTAVILDEAGLRDGEIAQWLRSRNRAYLANERPLDLIAGEPLRVLAAAEAEIVRRALEHDDARTPLKLVSAAECD